VTSPVHQAPPISASAASSNSASGATAGWYDRYWSQQAPPPDRDPLTASRVRLFLSVAREKRVVLDLGCGTGRATRWMEAAGKKVTGVDVSGQAIRHALRLGGTSCYVQADCDGPLPFADRCFEAIYCAEVIEHLLDPAAMLRECHRLLCPGGILFVSTPYHARIKNCVIAALAFERHFDPCGPHIRFFTPKSLGGLLARHGFQVKRTFRLGRVWPLWMNMLVSAERVEPSPVQTL